MNEHERYEFDLRGFLVLRGVLDTRELSALNEVIDQLETWGERSNRYLHVGLDESTMNEGNRDPEAGPVDAFDGVMLNWAGAFRRLVAHKRVAPFLATILGPDYRYDHSYAVLMRAEGATSGLEPRHALHNGGTPFDPTQHHTVHDGVFHSGLVAVLFALSAADVGDGGFCAIPGSHKSAYSLPTAVDGCDATNWLEQPSLAAGDCVVFSEAVTHGALPLVAAHEQRSLLYKYTPGYMNWESRSPFVDIDEHDWTLEERAVMHEPRALAD